MAEKKRLKEKDIEAMSETERKNYYKELIDSLRLEEKKINRTLAEKAKQQEIENRKRINHAKFIIAGELLNSNYAVDFLKDLASKTRYTKRHTEDLNLLMTSLGYADAIVFTEASENDNKKSD